MKKGIKFVVLLLVVIVAWILATHLISFDLLVRKLHGH